MAAVLVVDDDEAVRELLRLNLELEGHEVSEAADGRAALDQLDRLHRDVLLLDMMMPGINGADVLRQLAGLSPRPCVIAYSASEVHLGLARELGADTTVLKSGDLGPLLNALEACP